jgi:hypothetical protein
MPEGILCNKQVVDTKEKLNALLADKSGKQYYEEMKKLDVDTKALWATSKKHASPGCAHGWKSVPTAACVPIAVSCTWPTIATPNRCPPIRSNPPWGKWSNARARWTTPSCAMVMDTAWSKCTCCNRCATYCPFGIDMGSCSAICAVCAFSRDSFPGNLKSDRACTASTMPRWISPPKTGWTPANGWPRSTKMTGRAGDSRRQENADIIYTVNAREPKHYPEDLAEAAVLFHLAGENWTVPSEGWEETSLAMFAGDWGPARCRWKASMRPWTASSPNAWW